jgi:hypothetical protein
MSEKNQKHTVQRLISSGLSIFLTVSGVCVLSFFGGACAPLVNDWSDHTSAPKSAYQTGLAAGNSASDLLKNEHFAKVTVEIQSVRGYAPTPEALTHLQNFLQDRLNKPGGITIVNTGTIPGKAASTTTTSTSGSALPTTGATASTGTASASGPSYASSEIQALAHRYRRQYPRKNQLAVYILFVDGTSADDSPASATKTLGQAAGNTSITIFQGAVRAAAATNPAVQPWVIEATAMEHEFGRLLGLVHAPTSDIAHHEDQKHPGHCSSPTCLMHQGNDTSDFVTALTGPTGSFQPPSLDSNCLQDLKAAGGK